MPADPEKQLGSLSYIPSTSAFLDGFDYRLSTAQGLSNPVPELPDRLPS